MVHPQLEFPESWHLYGPPVSVDPSEALVVFGDHRKGVEVKVETAVSYRFLGVVLLCVLALMDCFRIENCFYSDFFVDFCFVYLSFYSSSCSFSTSAFRWQIQLCYGQQGDRMARVKPLRFLKVPEGSVAVQLHDYHLIIVYKVIASSILA